MKHLAVEMGRTLNTETASPGTKCCYFPWYSTGPAPDLNSWEIQGGIHLEGFQGKSVWQARDPGAWEQVGWVREEGDLSAGHGVSQQHAGREGVLGVGRAERFDLSFNTTPEFMLDWEGDGFRLQSFPVLTDNPLGQGCLFPFHLCIHALLGQEVLREERALGRTCWQM